ncbi:uncharacterized protein J4E87_009872 [Alternaria ethzedia]|uniref:uncharacterized protein n=1 Tax=Alternaria ethzedia TaxID=181014 RepID=UPI0020C3F233|nr:uncharacterized protein J4E87_009872 [Alternaria ethzedia]KAI4613405.1 hypothetical protein J4E87_009872 [Alternaria ethzedia]
MAPTTRSGSKRASGEAVDTKVTKKAKQFVKKAAKPAKSAAPASEAPQYFRFLDLSPELRNKVYGYATEDDSSRFAPRPCQLPHHSARASPTERPWKFFALTHVCTQVRAEYRPLWVRDLRVAFSSTFQLTAFRDTFLQFENEPKHMPKLIQYLWDHGQDDEMRFHLTPILRLHAHSPSSRLAIVPEKVALGVDVENDICHKCLMRHRHSREFSIYSDSEDEDDCSCPDFDMSQSEWEEFKHDQMEYTSDIPVFVHNTNEAWIKAVQEQKVTASSTFCRWSHHAVFKILYKDPVCETTADSQPAWDLMKQWGILDLQTKRGTDFIFAYEDRKTAEKDGYSMAHSVTRQIVFRKTPPKI